MTVPVGCYQPEKKPPDFFLRGFSSGGAPALSELPENRFQNESNESVFWKRRLPHLGQIRGVLAVWWPQSRQVMLRGIDE